MTIRLSLLCAGATASSRSGAFPARDEPLDEGGARKAASFRRRGAQPDHVVTSPSRAAIETAAAIGLDAAIEPALADLDYGDWAGRVFAGLDRAALAAWLADPTGATPGGETMADLRARVGGWMDAQAGRAQTLLVVSHAAVMRAALVHALSLPLAATLQIDIAPLATLELSFHGRWRLGELRRA